MSRILHLLNMSLRYGRSKGVRAHNQEEPPLGSLAAPCHLEENASHQDDFHDFGWLSFGCGVYGAKHSPPGLKWGRPEGGSEADPPQNSPGAI